MCDCCQRHRLIKFNFQCMFWILIMYAARIQAAYCWHQISQRTIKSRWWRTSPFHTHRIFSRIKNLNEFIFVTLSPILPTFLSCSASRLALNKPWMQRAQFFHALSHVTKNKISIYNKYTGVILNLIAYMVSVCLCVEDTKRMRWFYFRLFT